MYHKPMEMFMEQLFQCQTPEDVLLLFKLYFIHGK